MISLNNLPPMEESVLTDVLQNLHLCFMEYRALEDMSVCEKHEANFQSEMLVRSAFRKAVQEQKLAIRRRAMDQVLFLFTRIQYDNQMKIE